jgi:hypothetical protein
MAASKRKIGMYTITGITATIIVIAAIFVSGIQLPTDRNQTGTLAVSIKDAPVDLKSLVLTIDGLYILDANDDSWVELTLKEGQSMTFDLLQLAGEKSLQLSEQAVSVGQYSKIRIDVTEAIATYTDSKGVDHTDESLKVPPGHIDIITSFNIEGGQLTDLMIDMQPDTAAISQSGNFKPVVKMTVTPLVIVTPTPTPTATSAPT